MSRESLSPTLRDCLDVIKRLSERHGYPPSYREIAAGMRGAGSVGNTHGYVHQLAAMGYVRFTKDKRRNIVLADNRATRVRALINELGWDFVSAEVAKCRPVREAAL